MPRQVPPSLWASVSQPRLRRLPTNVLFLVSPSANSYPVPSENGCACNSRNGRPVSPVSSISVLPGGSQNAVPTTLTPSAGKEESRKPRLPQASGAARQGKPGTSWFWVGVQSSRGHSDPHLQCHWAQGVAVSLGSLLAGPSWPAQHSRASAPLVTHSGGSCAGCSLGAAPAPQFP